jgi:hypothetical protein
MHVRLPATRLGRPVERLEFEARPLSEPFPVHGTRQKTGTYGAGIVFLEEFFACGHSRATTLSTQNTLVAADDAFGVRGIQRVGDFDSELEHLL